MKYKIIFLIIFAFALVLRLSGITSNSGLSYDELFFWNIVANNDYTGIINTLIQTDYHPALYLILLKFWISIFGDSDISMQILSVGFSLLSVWIVYLIGKNLKNKQFGLILMAYFAFSYIFIAEAQTVRFYQMGQYPYF